MQAESSNDSSGSGGDDGIIVDGGNYTITVANSKFYVKCETEKEVYNNNNARLYRPDTIVHKLFVKYLNSFLVELTSSRHRKSQFFVIRYRFSFIVNSLSKCIRVHFIVMEVWIHTFKYITRCSYICIQNN